VIPSTLFLVAAALAAPRGPVQGVEAASEAVDPRTAYDVEAYALALEVDPDARRIAGSVRITAAVTAERLERFELDLGAELELALVRRLEPGPPGAFEPLDERSARSLSTAREGDRLRCTLERPAARGERLTLEVRYAGAPRALNNFDGFHWAATPSGAPWVATSCQTLGAFTWWPCKASYFHPEDKPQRVQVELTVPAGLVGVSNGLLAGRETLRDGRERFLWRLDAPISTYNVTLNVAPYVELAGELTLPGLAAPLPYHWFVLPEDVEKARLSFAEVPAILAAFSEAFGPWPFPRAKVGLVQTPFWGMEHSTAIAYGSSFPAWIARHGGEDRYALRNRDFDFILVHELAHEWWGNSLTAADWGDFWLHEGFASYAEGVYVERTRGREAAEDHFARARRSVPRTGALYRGLGTSAGEAYSGLLYGKGALVLDTARHYLDDDDLWWRALREFHARHRHANATTLDFQRVLEELSGRDWGRFFAEWVYGQGWPSVRGSVRVTPAGLSLALDNSPEAPEGFQVPLDLAWREGHASMSRRVWLEPGRTQLEIATAGLPVDVRVLHLERVLGRHEVQVE
jgi:aminopeptidase N